MAGAVREVKADEIDAIRVDGRRHPGGRAENA